MPERARTTNTDTHAATVRDAYDRTRAAAHQGGPPSVLHPAGGTLQRLADGAVGRSRQTGLIPGNSDPVGYWLTPPDLMETLDAEFGFEFDACPYPRPAGFDGLGVEWGDVTWVNPPFVGPGSSRIAWARKAVEESRKGKTVVMINSVDRWWVELVRAGAEFRVPPDFKWLDPKGRPQRAARPSLLFILRGRQVA